MANGSFHEEDAVHTVHAEPEEDRTLAEYDGADPLESDDGVLPEEVHDESTDHPAEQQSEHAAAPDEPVGPAKHWYIIHAYSGFEQKVAESLKTRAQAFGFADRVGQVLIPTEEVVELRNGKKVTSKRLLYPGYVLVEMEMDDELWHAVKSTPRVTGFVGGGTKPVPLTADEVNAVLYRQASSAERPRPKMSFEKNETVKIIDGPFTNFSGKVDEVNLERNTLRVMVTIFGRSTPVELDFLQVEKI
ncbi:MAG: transcription termination/antitermination protein NusG [Bryobacteraceae bacterium]